MRIDEEAYRKLQEENAAPRDGNEYILVRELHEQLADAVVREKEIRIEANYAGGVANDLHAKLVGLVRAGNNLRLQYALMTNRTDSIAVATKQDWDEALKAIKEVKV